MHFLPIAAVFLLTAVVLVPLFKRLQLGAVLGYLAAGMLIGPWGLGPALPAGAQVGETMEFAELGVVLLLFVIGLELEPRRLWVLRQPVFGLGGAQVAVCGVLLGTLALAFGLSWQAAFVVGAGLAMSSTALVLSSLSERGQLTARHGRDAFAVLLFQDLAVIPLLALLPLLAAETQGGSGGWSAAAKGMAVILVVIMGSRLVMRPALKLIAQHGGREVFTAAALLVVVGAALVTTWIGLSMSLGAFLAGVLLADSEFRHELEADIEPFKGLLLGLFFMAVGMSANLGLFAERPFVVLGLALLLLAAKLGALFALSRIAGAAADVSLRLGLALAQGGEFAFVLFTAAGGFGILDAAAAQMLVLVVTVSMLLAPLMFLLQDKVVDPWLERREEPEYDRIDGAGNPVIIAGFGRVGQIVGRVLRMSGITFTALERDYQQVDFVRRFGSKVYYGDASRLELLQAARAGEAKLFVLAIDDVEASVRTAGIVRRHFPDLPVIARARNRVHYFRLRDLGIENIFRETFPASTDMARLALLRLGAQPSVAERSVALFRRHDEEQLEKQYALQDDEAQLIQTAQQAAQQLRELFETDIAGSGKDAAAPAPFVPSQERAG